MYRRDKDYILTEVEKLAQALARLLGFKNNNQPQEAQDVYQDMLADDYGLHPDEVLALSEAEFTALIRQKGYSAGKLNILAQLLYHEATNALKHPAEAKMLLQKTLLVFDMLEQEHHMQSFENIGLRNNIQHLLKQS